MPGILQEFLTQTVTKGKPCSGYGGEGSSHFLGEVPTKTQSRACIIREGVKKLHSFMTFVTDTQLELLLGESGGEMAASQAG